MLILNETNYSNGKVTLYDNENNVVRNGHVDVYVGTNKVSTFSIDVYGQGTPSITAGIFYRFEVFDAVGELVSILEPVSLGESSSGGVTPAALEAETAARIAADDSLQEQINSKAYKSYVDDKLGQIAYDKRVIEAKINEEVTRAKDAEKANSDTIEEASNSIESHIADTTKHITEAERTKWNAAVQPSQLATVATTGSYSDLTGKPTIPPAITVDSAMSSTSTNPVQNKVVNAELDKCLKYVLTIDDSSGAKKCWIIKTKLAADEKNGTTEVTCPSLIRLIGGSYDAKSIDLTISSYRNPKTSVTGNFLGFVNLSGEFYPEVYEDYYTSDNGRLYKRYYIYCSSTKHAYKVNVYAQYQSVRFTKDSSLEGWTVEYSDDLPNIEENYCVKIKENNVIRAYSLLTPRSLGVNLARTAASTFDGSASQLDIPVKGTLPIANGGTGASTAATARTNLGLGSLATKSSVTDSDISGTIADSHIASASAWNGKQDALSFTTADEITEILGGLS